jgi:hypothetical protein
LKDQTRPVIDGKVECKKCNTWKLLEEYPKNKNSALGIFSYCSECSNKLGREHHKKNRAKGTEGWEKHRKDYRNRYYKNTYGITLAQFEEIFEAQDYKCAICFCPLDIDGESSKAHLDHNHTTGKIRQILCVRCNKGIGYLQEDTDIMQSAIDYINLHKEGT